MRVLVKGIVTGEDAALGGRPRRRRPVSCRITAARAESSQRSTIECVPEVVAAVAGRVPVIVDSGFRRGTDIFKALALGRHRRLASAGRTSGGLGAFGQDGVDAVLEMLQRELRLAMRPGGHDQHQRNQQVVCDRFAPPDWSRESASRPQTGASQPKGVCNRRKTS